MKKYLLLVAVVFAFFGCTKEAADNGANAAAAGTGTGGSLARFTIVGNYLYVADYARLQTFDISDPSKLVQVNDRTLGFDIETLFPYKDKLFVGAATGMYLLSLADPAKPLLLGSVAHLRSCDPVVANDSVAFVTLRGSGRCGAAVSYTHLDVYKRQTCASTVKNIPAFTVKQLMDDYAATQAWTTLNYSGIINP